MTREEQESRCKGCVYYKVYYHGMYSWMKESGDKSFTHECLWTLKDPVEMGVEECNRKEK